jgi:hypothetical protein
VSTMNESNVIAVFIVTVATSVLWYGYFWLYGDHRRAVFRNEMYRLQDELCTLNRTWALPMEHPGTTMLRKMIGGALESDHRIFFSDAVVRLIIAPRHSGHIETYLADWQICLKETDEQMRSILERLHESFHVALGRHAAWSMPLLSLNVLFLSTAVPVRVSCFSLADIGSYMVVLYPEIQYGTGTF